MIRAVALLVVSVKLVGGHQLCFTNDRPTDTEKTELVFCPNEQFGGGVFLQYGSCCTDLEEEVIEAKFLETTQLAPGGQLTAECADLYKQLVCTTCHSFSAHIFERLGAEFGPFDGMTLKREYCEALVDACEGQIAFGGQAEFGMSYCDQHVGGDVDMFWSYPYTDRHATAPANHAKNPSKDLPQFLPTRGELSDLLNTKLSAEALEPGLTVVFPNVPRGRIPVLSITAKPTPDFSEYWIGGIEGQVVRIPAGDRNTNQIFDVIDMSDLPLFYLEFEEGLLDLAFDPMFSDNNFFYISHTINTGTAENVERFNRISRFTHVPNNPADTLATELVILTSAMKFDNIHSAGWLDFTPSAFRSPGNFNDLYWTTGDGGPQTDPNGASQNLNNLLGSMMRISVPTFEGFESASGLPYNIPSGNYQDVDSSAAPEVCAIGLRNAFRCSFDSLNDDLWCGDVGQAAVESIYIIECGKNYGWSLFEGSSCMLANQGLIVDGVANPMCTEDMDRSAFEFPIYEYCQPAFQSTNPDQTGGVDICGDREIVGRSVIGGIVYRGSCFSDTLAGAYIFGDFQNRNIYFIQQNEDGVWVSGTIISDASITIVSMMEDENGEILLMSRNRDLFYLPCGDLCADEATPAPPDEATPAPGAEPTTPAPADEATPAPDAATPAPDAESTCINGFPGISADGVCCPSACGRCGGSGCNSFGGGASAGLGAASCCATFIASNGEGCSATVSAPCVIGPTL